MANGRGYLGKISAIVSANTGDYVRKLDDSAKRTAAFARTIQSDLTKASREASRSIDAILTPLQRFERAIQNAASARLKFRGIDVAVRTIEDLRRSLAALDSDQEKEFAVRVSGLRNITELKNVLTDIREEDIDLAVNVGGVEGLRRLRNQVREVNGEQINIRTGDSPARLEALIQKFSRLSPDRIRQISIAVEARQLDAAILKERQLVSLAKEIAAPLSASVAQFDKLTQEVQAGFIPALSAAQNRVEAVRDRIEAGGQVGQRSFRRIADEVRQTTEAIERLAEAQRLVQSIGTGRSLRDTSPRQFDALTRAAEQSRRSEQVSAQVAAQFGLGDRQQRVGNLAGQVSVLQARRESQEQDLIAAKKAKNSTLEAEIQRRLQLTIQYEARKTAELERQLGLQLNQIEAAERLDEAQRGSASSPFASFRDPQGRPLVERFREQERVRAEEERRAELAADQQRRREVATTFLPPVIDLPPDPRSVAVERTQALADRLGVDLDSSSAAVSRLESSTISLKKQVEQLPAPLRLQLIPLLRQAESDLLRLAAADDTLPEDLQRAASAVANLERGYKRAASASQILSSSDAIERLASRELIGQLEASSRLLAQVGEQAGGPVASAYDRLAEFIRKSLLEGTTGTSQFRKQLAGLQQDLARTAAETGKVSFSRAFREIQRGGDIARGAFGNAGLAIQQAAFAVDDFFSVTGGLDQRIRAAGNNLSQLGFILGSTQGLFAGIGISIGAQVIASLIRLAPIVREAEAQQQRFAAEIANANSALERQQQIAERLATAYRALGDSIAESGFSEEGRTASGRAGRLRDIAQIQGEQRGVIAEQASVGVQRLSAIRSDFERRLQDATDPAVATTFRNAAQSVQRDIVSFVRDVENSATDQLRRARAAGGNVDRGLAADLEAATARRATALASQAAAGGAGRNPAVDRLVDETDRLVAALTVARQRLQDEAAIDRAGVAQAVGDSLGRIQSAVSGVSGFTDVAQRANESASRLRQLIQDSTERPVDALIEQLGRFSRTLEEVAIATSSFSDSLDRAAGNLAREVETELTSRAERARRDANQVESRFGGGDRRAVVARFGEEQARDAAAAQTRNRRAIEEEINRLRGQFEAAAFAGLGRGAGGQQAVDIARQIQELRQIAADTTRSAETRQSATLEVDALQRRLSDLFDALPEAAALRRRADQGDIEAQRRQRSLELAARGGDLARSPAQQFSEELADGIAAIREFYSQLAEATTGVVDFASQNQAIQRLVEQSQIDLLRTPAEQAAAQLQQQFGQIAAVQQGLGRAGLADQGVLAARGDAARRRAILGITDIGLSEQQQFARQLESNLGDLEAQARGFLQIGDRQAAAAAVDNGQRNLARQNAPLFAQFSDEVANAVLQGPSRAALQVSDASTTEGQRELNRLLRGDDSARDVNLVELQKQSTFLQSIDSGISTLKERLGIAQ